MFNTHAGDIRLIGGRLCLDFVNTVDSHLKTSPKEYLHSYDDFVTWSEHAGVLAADVGHYLGQEAAGRPEEAALILNRALILRSALYRIFSAIAGEHMPAQADHAVVNDTLAAIPPRSRIIQNTTGYSWEWPGAAAVLARPLWVVAWSAADLLTAPELIQVRECTSEQCSWLFLDTSHNRSRRWCSMEDCGNRTKAQRHYARHRSKV